MSAERWAAAHERACDAGHDGYLDPETGLFVMTRLALLRRPCCGNGCRHCPYQEGPDPVDDSTAADAGPEGTARGRP